MEKNVSYFGINIVKPLNTAGKTSTPLNLPDNYNRIVGVAIVVKEKSNQTNFLVELSNGREALLQEVHHAFLVANENVAPDKKFLSCNYPYKSTEQLRLITNNLDSVAGKDLDFDLVLQLANDNGEAAGMRLEASNSGRSIQGEQMY